MWEQFTQFANANFDPAILLIGFILVILMSLINVIVNFRIESKRKRLLRSLHIVYKKSRRNLWRATLKFNGNAIFVSSGRGAKNRLASLDKIDPLVDLGINYHFEGDDPNDEADSF